MKIAQVELEKSICFWVGSAETPFGVGSTYTAFCEEEFEKLFGIKQGDKKLRMVVSTKPSKKRREIAVVLKRCDGQNRANAYLVNGCWLNIIRVGQELIDILYRAGITKIYAKVEVIG